MSAEGNQDAVEEKIRETTEVEPEDEVKAHQRLLDEEDKVREKVDKHGNKWKKVYFGGGPHFRNWLDQTIELRGKRNVEVEQVNVPGLSCSAEAGEKMYRIWVRENKSATS